MGLLAANGRFSRSTAEMAQSPLKRTTNVVHPPSPSPSRTLVDDAKAVNRRKEGRAFGMYCLFLVAFLAVQFGHGSNIGVAVSLPVIQNSQGEEDAGLSGSSGGAVADLGGDSKAMNLALGSWVMAGVCLGLPLTPWACRRFGALSVTSACAVVDFGVVLLMLWPSIGLRQIYAVRFLVGFFEAPFLPYLQEWLARFGQNTWNVWNTVLHAMVPLGENLGYFITLELVSAGYSWQWAFGGQALALAMAGTLCVAYGGRRYLDLTHDGSQVFVDDPSSALAGQSHEAESDNEAHTTPAVEYPVMERWAVYWATNASLAAQLGFLSGSKYVIRDYAVSRGFSANLAICAFTAIALFGPAIGGSVAMSGSLIKPDRWSQHRTTLLFLTCTSSLAAGLVLLLPRMPELLFWPVLFTSFCAAGGVYPAAQGIINIALTSSRVIEASVYQVQLNNILFAMPLPFCIGKAMDMWGADVSFHCVLLLQTLAAFGFLISFLIAMCTEEANGEYWHRLRPHHHCSTELGSYCAAELGSPPRREKEGAPARVWSPSKDDAEVGAWPMVGPL